MAGFLLESAADAVTAATRWLSTKELLLFTNEVGCSPTAWMPTGGSLSAASLEHFCGCLSFYGGVQAGWVLRPLQWLRLAGWGCGEAHGVRPAGCGPTLETPLEVDFQVPRNQVFLKPPCWRMQAFKGAGFCTASSGCG